MAASNVVDHVGSPAVSELCAEVPMSIRTGLGPWKPHETTQIGHGMPKAQHLWHCALPAVEAW